MKKAITLIVLLALLMLAIVPAAALAQDSVGDRYEKMVQEGLVNPCTGYASVAGVAAGLPSRTSFAGVAQVFPWVMSIEDGSCFDMSFSIDAMGFFLFFTPEMKAYMTSK